MAARHTYTRVLEESSSAPLVGVGSPQPSPAAWNGRRTITLEEGWNTIFTQGILKLHRIIQSKGSGRQFTHQEHVALYTIVYNMCNQKAPYEYTRQLYKLFGQSIEHYLKTTSLPLIQERTSGAYLVRELVSQWNDHQLISRWMCKFFEYLNRFFVKRGSLPTLEQVCTTTFKSTVFDTIQGKLGTTLLVLIQTDREDVNYRRANAAGNAPWRNERNLFDVPSSANVPEEKKYHRGDVDVKGPRDAPDRKIMRRAIEIYIAMDVENLTVYHNDLESAILKDTAEFYTARCARQLARLSCPQFLVEAEADLNSEEERVRQLLHSSTMDKLLSVVRSELLMKRQTEILTKEKGLHELLEEGAVESLSRLYNLYNPCGHQALVIIANMVREFTSKKGTAVLVQAREGMGPETVVSSLVELHRRCYKLIQNAFQGSPLFHKSLKEAFEIVVNNRVKDVTVAEMFSIRLHNLLRKGGASKGMEANRLTEEISELISLFGYLAEKDHFAEFYRNDLAERLLYGRSASLDMEKVVIGKLKYACGAQYTSKIEGMLNDSKNASETSANFKRYLERQRIRGKAKALPMLDQGGEFGARVLTSGFWPPMPPEELGLPENIVETQEEFENYYESKFGRRKLNWIHSLATVTIEATINNRTYDFLVNGYQAAVLVATNSHPEGLSIEALQKITKLSQPVMKRVLLCLVLKTKILMKRPKKDYKITDVILGNPKFHSAQRRLRVPSHKPSKEAKAKSRKAAVEGVTKDRKAILEVAIVKFMKARAIATHKEVVNNVLRIVGARNGFQPSLREIKNAIESLMSREYLERDPNDTEKYRYLA